MSKRFQYNTFKVAGRKFRRNTETYFLEVKRFGIWRPATEAYLECLEKIEEKYNQKKKDQEDAD